MPDVLDEFNVKVASAEDPPVRRGVVRRHDQTPARSQDPLDLSQGKDPIVEVVDHERHHRRVEAFLVQPVEGRAQVVYPDLDPIAASEASETNHLRALIEGNDVGPPSEEFLRVDARTASDVQDPSPAHIAEQLEDSRPVVEGVVRADLHLTLVPLRERVVERLVPRGAHGETSNGCCGSPRTSGRSRKSPPARVCSESCSSDRLFRAVVTNSSELSLPPNAQLVTLLTGNSTVVTTRPSGSNRRTAEPPQNATQGNPSASTVMPSGRPHSSGIPTSVRRFATSPLSMS